MNRFGDPVALDFPVRRGRIFLRVAAVKVDSTAPRSSTFDAVVFRGLPLAVMLLAAAFGLLAGSAWSKIAGPGPWILSLFFVGLPHGAADLAVAHRLCAGRSTTRLCVVYLAGIAVVCLLFRSAPLLVILLFTVLSIWHFGLSHADNQSPATTPGCGLAVRWRQVLAALARGSSVLGVPMLAWPKETAQVAQQLLALIHSGTMQQPSEAFFAVATVRLAGLCLVGLSGCALVVEMLTAGHVPGAWRRSWETLVDLFVIGLLALTTDPLFSVGLYFLVWHAWRHMRMLAPIVADTQPDRLVNLGRSLRRIHIAALPLLIPTWAALLAIWWLLSATHSYRDLAILSLAVYVVVTPSHDLLVDYLRTRGEAASGCLSQTPATVSL